MVIAQETLQKWFRAIEIDSANFTNTQVKAFKETYAFEYGYLSAFYHLRTRLNRDIEVMSLIAPVHWFTLTFDNKRDKSKIESKRKSATRFLNDLFLVYEMVEEFGEDKGRYHIHGFGCFRENRDFSDFIKWPCRNKIQCLDKPTIKKKVKYLTNYAVKDLPRIRRSKSLVFMIKYYNQHRKFKNSFNRCFMCGFNIALCKASFSLYNQFEQRHKPIEPNHKAKTFGRQPPP